MTTPDEKTFATLTKLFEEEFGPIGDRQVLYVHAPGRSEISGNHTDHEGGHVIAGSLDVAVDGIAVATDSNKVRVADEGYPTFEIALDTLDVQESEKGTSASLVRGMAHEVAALGVEPHGFDFAFTCSVPSGGGLSSSAAVEAAYGRAMETLWGAPAIEPVTLAQMSQRTENNYYGKPCGLMDQTACAVGGVITIDFKDPAHPVVGQTAIDLAKHGFVMCISDTKGSHADLTDDYAAIRREMESVAEQFGKKVLREVDEDEFYKALPKLRKAVGDRAVVRAMHFYNDCRRAAQLCDAVREDDFETFLRLIIEGGHSSFEFNQNAYSIKNPKEQGVPVALALSQRVLNGRGAWRLQGGGFAGTIQAFVPVDLLDAYKAAIDGCFGEGSCHVLNIRNYGAVPVTPDM